MTNWCGLEKSTRDSMIMCSARERPRLCMTGSETYPPRGDAVSITNVIELVDRAIRKANKFFRKMGSGKKRYDENDCVILQEKDFR